MYTYKVALGMTESITQCTSGNYYMQCSVVMAEPLGHLMRMSVGIVYV